MIFKPFLTSEDISSLQIQEAQSSKNKNARQNKSKLFIVMAIIFWCLHRLVLGKPLSWLNALLIKFCVV